MAEKPDIAIFLESPEELLNLCREVIDELVRLREDKSLAEQEKQLREISRAIHELEKVGTPVPYELRSFKVNLVARLAVKERHESALETLADGLEKILLDLQPKIGRPEKTAHAKPKRKRRSKKPKTDKDVLRKEIIRALKKLGGRAHLRQVLSEMERQLHDKFLPGDLEKRQSGEIAWENNACWERFRMVKDGILRDDSPRGIWELSEEYK